jgi:hypothetical protein
MATDHMDADSMCVRVEASCFARVYFLPHLSHHFTILRSTVFCLEV